MTKIRLCNYSDAIAPYRVARGIIAVRSTFSCHIMRPTAHASMCSSQIGNAISWKVIDGSLPNSIRAIWDRDKSFKLWVQRVKLQGHNGPSSGRIHWSTRGVDRSFRSSLKRLGQTDRRTDGRARAIMRPTRQRHNERHDRYDIIDTILRHRIDSTQWTDKARIPLRRLPRTGKFRGRRRNGIWAKGDVTGLSRTSRGSRHSGIWA